MAEEDVQIEERSGTAGVSAGGAFLTKPGTANTEFPPPSAPAGHQGAAHGKSAGHRTDPIVKCVTEEEYQDEMTRPGLLGTRCACMPKAKEKH